MKISTGQAGKQLGALVERVLAGESFELTRYGRTVALLVPYVPEDALAQAASVTELPEEPAPAQPNVPETPDSPPARVHSVEATKRAQAGRDALLSRMRTTKGR